MDYIILIIAGIAGIIMGRYLGKKRAMKKFNPPTGENEPPTPTIKN